MFRNQFLYSLVNWLSTKPALFGHRAFLNFSYFNDHLPSPLNSPSKGDMFAEKIGSRG